MKKLYPNSRRYDLLAHLEQRQIIRSPADIRRAKSATKYLAKKQRVVYTVLRVDGKPLTLTKLIQLNSLLAIGHFGHLPLLVLDDVNTDFGLISEEEAKEHLYNLTKQGMCPNKQKIKTDMYLILYFKFYFVLRGIYLWNLSLYRGPYVRKGGAVLAH